MSATLFSAVEGMYDTTCGHSTLMGDIRVHAPLAAPQRRFHLAEK